MTDFTEQFTKETGAETAANSSLSQELQVSMDEDQAKEDKRKSSRFEAAYEATDLPVSGPSKDKYDYEKDFNEGNTLKTDDGGGIQINNSSYKPGAVNVAGRDLATGRQYTNQFADPEGKIEQGIGKLQKEDHNTKAGSSYRNTYGLYDVARGIIDEDGSFDDFANSVSGPWSNDQLSMAYTSAKATKDVMSDVDSLGRRYYDEMRDEYDQFEGRISNIPAEGYTEESLAKSEDWLKSGREFLSVINPNAADLTDEQVDSSLKSTMSMFRNNLPMMATFANMALQDETGTIAKNLLVMDEMYDSLEMSGPVASRAVGALFGDVANYITLGGGILVTGLGKEATKEGVRHALKRLAHGIAYDAAVGAGFGAEYENNIQDVEIAAGTRGEKDPAKIALMGGVEGAANALIGGPLNVLTDKTLRGFAGTNIKKGLGMLKENSKTTFRHPSGLKGQRGSIDFGPLGSDKVQLTFKMQDWLESTVKDGAKPTTIRQTIKEGINKGIIKPEEVKWSGIEKFLTDAESRGGTGISKFRMMKIIEQETPQVKMVPVAKESYETYSLLTNSRTQDETIGEGIKGAGYRERMLVIPPARGTNPQSINPRSGIASKPLDIGDDRYRPGHFTGPQHEQLQYGDDMIGHSRVENAELGDSKGKMVLEIQSDYHKSGQQEGYVDSPKGDVSVAYDAGIGKQDDNIKLIKLAEEHGIDPFEKNAIAKIWPYLDDKTKAKVNATRPESKPYGKNWDAMGMRMEILDSINNGDEFIAWPANAEQINVIEQWGSGYSNEGIVKRATETRIKAMKKLGLEVERVDMPQYKELGKTDMTSEAGIEEFNNAIDQRGQAIVEIWDEANQKYTYKLYADPDGTIDVDVTPPAGSELLKTMTETEYYDFAEEILAGQGGIQDSTFNVIRLTKEVKDKFLKEGMPAFSVGAMAIPEESKSERRKQKRGKDGKFK